MLWFPCEIEQIWIPVVLLVEALRGGVLHNKKGLLSIQRIPETDGIGGFQKGEIW
jgi:hypothetical protein